MNREALREHRGFTRSTPAKRLHIRHTLELHFKLDETERLVQSPK